MIISANPAKHIICNLEVFLLVDKNKYEVRNSIINMYKNTLCIMMFVIKN